MANWDNLKSAIEQVIKQNGNQEITGEILQNTLKSIVNNVGKYATFAGIATPETNPGTPDGPVFYLAATAGTYVNFNSIDVSNDEIAIIIYLNSTWNKLQANIASSLQLNAISGKSIGTIDFATKNKQFWDGKKYVAHEDFNSTDKIYVNKNSTVQITGAGGANARLVYYYNNKDVNLLIADALSELVIIDVIEDGYIICNTKNTKSINILKLSDASVIHQQSSAIAKNTSAIAKNTSAIFKEDTYSNTFLQVGYFYNLKDLKVGDAAPSSPEKFIGTPDTEWGCMKISVIKDMIITIAVIGGVNGRAYALTDKNNKILAIADENLNTINNPISLTVKEDGYLIVNQHDTTNTNFNVSVGINNIAKNTSAIFKEDTYSNTFLQVGYFYNLKDLKVGDAAPSSPEKFIGTPDTEWGCMKISVIKDMIITIAVIGGVNGRAYALTDKNNKILAIADENLNTINNPISLTVKEDGYLIVNQHDTTNTNFNVSVSYTINDEINNLQSRVSSLENAEHKAEVFAPCMYNPTPNLHKEQLKILDIGNSYTVDATHYLPQIIAAAGVDISNICLYTAVRGGGSFKSWFDTYHDKDTKTYSIEKLLGGLNADITGTAGIGDGEKFRNTLSNNYWDIIIIHQVSTYAPYYDTWQGDADSGYLNKFIRLLRKNQPQASIGFLLVHSYWSGYSGNVEKSSLKRWELIAESAKKLRANFGIDFIIPYGTAIQNLRKSSLNNEYDLTADGTHCANGLADYTAACSYYQALFAPRYKINILGNTARITVEQTEQYPSSDISVTDDTAPVAQKAAFLAAYNWYKCVNPDDINDEDLI